MLHKASMPLTFYSNMEHDDDFVSSLLTYKYYIICINGFSKYIYIVTRASAHIQLVLQPCKTVRSCYQVYYCLLQSSQYSIVLKYQVKRRTVGLWSVRVSILNFRVNVFLSQFSHVRRNHFDTYHVSVLILI